MQGRPQRRLSRARSSQSGLVRLSTDYARRDQIAAWSTLRSARTSARSPWSATGAGGAGRRGQLALRTRKLRAGVAAIAAFTVGTQLYFFARYHAYMNARGARGNSMLPELPSAGRPRASCAPPGAGHDRARLADRCRALRLVLSAARGRPSISRRSPSSPPSLRQALRDEEQADVRRPVPGLDGSPPGRAAGDDLVARAHPGCARPFLPRCRRPDTPERAPCRHRERPRHRRLQRARPGCATTPFTNELCWSDWAFADARSTHHGGVACVL